jgi:release factor glutamine methyltransferase
MNGPTVQALLADAVRALSDFDTARLDAEVLLQDVLKTGRAWLYAHACASVAPGPASDFRRLVASRSRGLPVAYLLGRREFWSLSMQVDGCTLIPRPETELLVETGLELLQDRRSPRVLDLGTGCGAIALAMAKERSDAGVVAADLSPEALGVAHRNAARHGLSRIDFRHSDWFSALAGERFDLILCNPPYVDSADPALAAGELRFEPRLALDGGRGGLSALRAVIAGARRHLHSGGFIVLEHGRDQAGDVGALLDLAGFTGIATRRDAAGLERASFGTWR